MIGPLDNEFAHVRQVLRARGGLKINTPPLQGPGPGEDLAAFWGLGASVVFYTTYAFFRHSQHLKHDLE